MARSILRYLSPARWRRFAANRLEVARRDRADDALDAAWQQCGQIQVGPEGARVIADGMWRNPAHFFRLRLMIEALAKGRVGELVGVLRTPKQWREQRALERIGFSQFLYIESDSEFPVQAFAAQARELLAGVRTHQDLLRIVLPQGFPAYYWYDSVLKNTRHGRPPIDHPDWHKTLCETLAYLSIYDRLLGARQVSHVILSHAWNAEWATLAWLALKRGIPTFLMTAFSEAIRIRRFRTPLDLELPVEFMPRREFDALPREVRHALVEYGRKQLVKRQESLTQDVNIRHAYVPLQRTLDRSAARRLLGVGDDRPLGIVYGHAWFDFPHLYGMRNFTDFLDWFSTTLAQIKDINSVTWLLKPHPMEDWYGGHKMLDYMDRLPPHVRVISSHVDTTTVMAAANSIVTVHGTAALEATAQGVPVIAADRSYYSAWDFAHTASGRQHYLELLARVGQLPAPTVEQRNLAIACFASAYAEPEPNVGALAVPCDSQGSDLYEWVRTMACTQPLALRCESDRIAEFVAQDEIDSFAVYYLVKAARARQSIELEALS